MARAKVNLAGRMEAGYFQKRDSKESRNTAINKEYSYKQSRIANTPPGQANLSPADRGDYPP